MRRLGRELLLRVRPPGDRRRDERGRCSICGHEGRFVANSWILPPDMVRDLSPQLRRAFVRRETLWCRVCMASTRVRGLADVLLLHYAERATTLAELVQETSFAALDVAEINSIGAVHDVLARHPRLVYSEYPDEDLLALSYADASFDLVLTSDTLEHVPDPALALRETRRVLRPGGRHVFTVPYDPGRERTRARAEIVGGAVVNHEPPQHHGRGSGPFRFVGRRSDYLAFTDFGRDLVDLLRESGFEPELHGGGVDTVFCARAV